MNWIRPEARAFIMKWREVAMGAILFAIGLNWTLTGYGLAPYVGAVLVLIGTAVLYTGWRRVQLPAGGGGPGVVEVTERQITYLSAQGGGALAVDGLLRVEVATTPDGALTWHFLAEDGGRLDIPGAATGAEGLLDALVSLKGVNYDQASAAIRASGADRFLIWQRDQRLLH